MYQEIDETTSQTPGRQQNGCCDPLNRYYRYLVLIFICGMGFGSYFAYDSPAALEQDIEREMDVSTAQFASLYSWYSWPNVILCFFGGFLIDRVFGVRWGAIIFSTIILIGQLILSFGAFVNAFWLMDVGRFVFGIGGESLAVAQNTYAVSWFKDKELNLVFGLQLSLSRVGSTVGLNTVKPMFEALRPIASGYTLLGWVFFFTSATCAFSMVCSIVAGILDKRAERVRQASNLEGEQEQEPELIRLSDIRTFDSSFWYLTFVCVLFYNCIFPFVSLGTVFFKRKFSLDDGQANGVDSVVYTISAVASPIFGYFIDITGRNLLWILSASLLALGGHALLAFTFITPWFSMVIMGIAYCILACALWPMVSYIIPSNRLATAYGIMQAFQNFGLAVTPLIAGYLVDLKGYILLEVFFLANMCGCILFVVLLFISDTNSGGILNMSPATRLKYNEEKLCQASHEESTSTT